MKKLPKEELDRRREVAHNDYLLALLNDSPDVDEKRRALLEISREIENIKSVRSK